MKKAAGCPATLSFPKIGSFPGFLLLVVNPPAETALAAGEVVELAETGLFAPIVQTAALAGVKLIEAPAHHGPFAVDFHFAALVA